MPKLVLKSKHRLMCGDSTSEADVDKLMDGEKADMVFTDPPYGMFLDADYSKMGSSSVKPGKKHDKPSGYRNKRKNKGLGYEHKQPEKCRQPGESFRKGNGQGYWIIHLHHLRYFLAAILKPDFQAWGLSFFLFQEPVFKAVG